VNTYHQETTSSAGLSDLDLFTNIPASLTSQISEKTFNKYLSLSEDSASVENEYYAESSSSDIAPANPQMLSEIDTIFAHAQGEYFEDGVETEFSRRLTGLLENSGNEVVKSLQYYLGSFYNKPDIISEALRWVGLVKNSATHQERLILLISCLSWGSAKVRDGANLGLAFMEDPSVIPYLERAVEKENVPQLRSEMIQVLDELTEIKQELESSAILSSQW